MLFVALEVRHTDILYIVDTIVDTIVSTIYSILLCVLHVSTDCSYVHLPNCIDNKAHPYIVIKSKNKCTYIFDDFIYIYIYIDNIFNENEKYSKK